MSSGSRSRQRSGQTDSKQTAAKAHATTADSQNVAFSSVNGNPGTTKKIVNNDGVTIESTANYVSPDGKSQSFSKSTSTSTKRQGTPTDGQTKKPTTDGTNVENKLNFVNLSGKGRSPVKSTSSSAKAQGVSSDGQNYVFTSANGNPPGTIKKIVTNDGVTMESTSNYVSPDGKSRSFSKSTSTSSTSPGNSDSKNRQNHKTVNSANSVTGKNNRF